MELIIKTAELSIKTAELILIPRKINSGFNMLKRGININSAV